MIARIGRARARAPPSSLMPARFQVDDADYGRLRQAVSEAGGELVRDGATVRFKAALRGIDAPRVRSAAGDARGACRVRPLLPADRPPDAARPRESSPMRSSSFFAAPVWSSRRRGSERVMVFNSLHFVWFFLVVYAAVPGAAASRAELAAARCELLLLRLVGLALPRPADRLDARGLQLRARARPRPTSPRRGERCSCSASAFNLTLLGFFKYFNFFADNLHAVFGSLGWQPRFRHAARPAAGRHLVLHVPVDELRHRRLPPASIQPTRNLLDFAVFVAFFPHLVAGPILRAVTLLPQIDAAEDLHTRSDARRAVADRLGVLQEDRSSPTTLPAIANIVFDPGAHHDRRRTCCWRSTRSRSRSTATSPATRTSRAASSKLLGIELIENFSFPYFVAAPQDFWRHWHISLSTWLRDYLYIPLGGSRGSAWQTRPQPADHDGARRPVARRGLDVRALGRVPRRAADRVSRCRTRQRPCIDWISGPRPCLRGSPRGR